jgi:hypothetical protein
VAGSLKPDSVYASVPFNMAFDIAAVGFAGPIDSTHVTIRLVSPFDTVHALLFDGPLMSDSFTAGVISYSGVPAFIDSGLGHPPGTRAISLVHTLVSEGSIITLSDWGTDSLHLLPSVALQYVAESFTPVEVASGQEVSFEFEFYLDGSQSVLLEPSGSSFGIAGPGFIATTNLIVDGDSLLPGINQVASERVYIPLDQLDEMLTPTVSLTYRHRGAANELLFETLFDGQLVAVAASPVVQIIETWIVAPNAPNINTGKEFQISCRIANLSISDQDPFPVRMVTNGGSIFDGDKTIAGIPGGDTISISYDVVASVSRNSAEIFRIDIASDDVSQLPPLDNIALATIQEPAMLSLEHFLLGAEQGYVNVNDEFNLLVSLVNAGEAAVSTGRFRITTEGLDDSTPDTLIGTIEVGTPVSIAFVAPPHDTTVSINFILIERPLDLNTNGLAQIGDTAFERQLVVTSLEARLLAEADVVTSNLVLKGAEKELFRLSLTNQGSGAISDILLKSVALVFTDRMSLPLDVRSVLELGNTGFYDGDSRVVRAVAGGNRLRLMFDDYVIPVGETVRLDLRTKVKAGASDEFGMNLSAADIVAVFAGGPREGQAVTVATADGADIVLEEVYTTVDVSLAGSFTIKDNPFNPNLGPATFQYNLNRPGAVEFRILSLIGEEVFSFYIPEGAPGASTGLQTIFWDGRNDDGLTVLNGVYIAVITSLRDRAQARMKVAVVK